MCWGGTGGLHFAHEDRHRVRGLRGCSHLLHHRIPGEFVVAGGGCRNRKCGSMNYLMLSICSPKRWGHHRERACWLPGYSAQMTVLYFCLPWIRALFATFWLGLHKGNLMVLWDTVVQSGWPTWQPQIRSPLSITRQSWLKHNTRHFSGEQRRWFHTAALAPAVMMSKTQTTTSSKPASPRGAVYSRHTLVWRRISKKQE